MNSWCDYKTSSINYVVTSHAKYHHWELFWGHFCFWVFFDFWWGIGLGFLKKLIQKYIEGVNF